MISWPMVAQAWHRQGQALATPTTWLLFVQGIVTSYRSSVYAYFGLLFLMILGPLATVLLMVTITARPSVTRKDGGYFLQHYFSWVTLYCLCVDSLTQLLPFLVVVVCLPWIVCFLAIAADAGYSWAAHKKAFLLASYTTLFLAPSLVFELVVGLLAWCVLPELIFWVVVLPVLLIIAGTLYLSCRYERWGHA